MSLLRRCVLIGVTLVLWEAFARSGWVNPIVCPSLLAIAREVGQFVTTGERLMEAWYSLYRALAGFLLAVAVGVPLGATLGRVRWLERVFDPFFSLTYPVPKIAFYPIFVFALGIGSLSKVALGFLECFYPIVMNSAAGVRRVDRVLVWSGTNMGASRLQILRKIVLPAAAPAIFAGFRIALPLALVVVIVTEMIGSADGLGHFIMAALADLRTDRMLAGVVAVAVIGALLDVLLVGARRRAIFWERRAALLDLGG